MLELKNYSNYILEDINFKIDNKNLIIVGDNGAGKTTLAKVLSGLIKSENVDLENKALNDTDYESRVKLVNYIPAKLDIFDDYISVKEYLELSGIIDSKRVDEVLELFNIKNLKDQPCKFLSSGESQLVLLSSAILHNAKYTILDEPTSNLDPIKIQKVFAVLKDHSYMKNKIIITHNLNLAYKLGYDIIFIKDGKIKFQGISSEFFTQKNLDTIYEGTVKKYEDNIVVDI
ncbi:MAG: ABC transporter ATP-binding protein [Campylobacterota bacterium]|nr:ABC transporter ATP-binding protein [Campylobacterota bacterium]